MTLTRQMCIRDRYFEKAKIQTNKVKKTIRIKRKECRINQKSALKREFSLRKGKVYDYLRFA